MKILISVLFLVFSVHAYSNPGDWMPEPKNIKHILIEADTALIVIEGGVPAEYIPPQCNSGYNTVDLNTEHGKAVLSVALAARMSGQPVKLALGCFTNSRPFVTHIRL